MTLEESTIELAVSHARIASEQEDPVKFICEVAWCMLGLLHDLMVKEKQITGLSELGSDTKLKFWTLACIGRPDGSKFKRISICKALYIYSLIIQNDTSKNSEKEG
jgi:hypothetical protein